MNNATGKPKPRTGVQLSPQCQVAYGHRPHCSPGPVMVGDVEVFPRSCFCPCHDEKAAR
jgi:hypothetical protein